VQSRKQPATWTLSLGKLKSNLNPKQKGGSMDEEPEIVKIPEKTDGILGAIIAGFIAGAACVLGLLKIIAKE
jgi:hypothetical protein